MANGTPIWFATYLDNAGLKNGQAEADRIWNNLQGGAKDAGSGIEAAMKKAGAAVGAYLSVNAFTNFARQMVDVRGQFQQLEIAFGTMLKSGDKAKKLMSDLSEFAATTPFGLQSSASAAKQLLAYGSSVETLIDEMRMLGDVAAGTSQPIGDLVYLYGTLRTQGRAYMMDIRQFAGRGIPIYDELAKVLGVSKDRVNELVSAGKVGFAEVEQAFKNMTSSGGMYGGLMEAQSKSVTGRIEQLKDAVDIMFNEMGKASEGAVYGAISGAASLVENYEKVGKILIGLIATYGAYRTAVIVATVAEKGWTVAQLAHYNVLLIVEKAQKLLNKTMLANPYVLVATVLVGLVATMWALRDSSTAAERAQEQLNKRQEEFAQKERERRSRIDELIRIIQDETQTIYAQIAAYEELQKLSPALTAAYTREKLAVAELAATNRELNAEQDGRNFDKLIADIDNAQKNIARLKKEWQSMASVPEQNVALMQLDKQIKDQEAELAILLKNLTDYNERMAEAEFNALPPAEKIKIKEEQLEKIRSEFERARAVLEEEQRKMSNNEIFYIPFELQARVDALRSDEAAARAEISSIKASGDTEQTLSEEERKKLADDARRRREQAKQNADALKKLEIQFADDVAQARIDAMDEGLDKTLSQNELNFRRELAQIKEQEAELLAARQKTLPVGKAAILTFEEQSGFADQATAAQAERDKANKAALDADNKAREDALDGFRSFEQEYLRLYEEFQEKRRKAAENGADSLGLERADADFEDSIKQLAERMSESNPLFKTWADGINEMVNGVTATGADAIIQAAISNLNEQLVAAKAQLAAIKESGVEEGEGEALRQAMAQIEVLKKALADVQNQGTKTENVFARWKDVNKVIGQSADVFRDLGNEIGGVVGDVLSEIGEMTNAVLGAANSITALFEGGLKPVVEMAEGISDVTDKVSGVADTATEAMGSVADAATGASGAIGTAAASLSAMEKASVILTVISLAVQAITALVSSANKATKKHFDNILENIQKAYDEIEKRREDPLFFRLLEDGSLEEINQIIDAYGRVADAFYKKVEEIREDARYFEPVFTDDFLEQQKMIESFGKSVGELSAAFVDLGYNAGKAFGDQKYDTVKQDLADISQQILIMEQEAIAASNAAAASKAKGDDKRKYNEQAEAARQRIRELTAEGAQVLTNAINDAMGTTSDQIAETLGNALFDAFDQGIDAAEAWGKAVKDVIRDIARNTLIEQWLTKKISGIIGDITGDWYDSNNNFVGLDHVRKDLRTLAEQLNALGSEFEGAAKIINEQFGTGAEDVADAARSAASQGFAQASQDSIDETNGILTNIQNHTYGIFELLKTGFGLTTPQLAKATLPSEALADIKVPAMDIVEIMRTNKLTQQANTDTILGHLSAIHRNTDRLEAVENHLLTTNRRLEDISSGITQLNRG